MTAYDPSQWSDFAVAQVGASAALLGLVFVGMSINLKEFVGTPLLVNRALEAIVLLASVLVTATAVLMPGQGREAVGVELIVLGALVIAAVLRLQAGSRADVVERGDRGPTEASVVSRRVIGIGSAALVVIAGALLLAEAGGGLYWWPAAIVVAYLGALVNAWVLLVEILR
jgi:modulator of FtsH protease